MQHLKDCGVEVVYFTGTPEPNFENLLDAAKQLDYAPLYMTERNFYAASFAAWNQSGNADNVFVNTQIVPFDQAATSPATQTYLDVVKSVGGDTSTLGALSASAFLLWATAVDQCGADVTRDCVVGNIQKVTEWDAGGLQAMANPGENEATQCAMTLRMQGTDVHPVGPGHPGSVRVRSRSSWPTSRPRPRRPPSSVPTDGLDALHGRLTPRFIESVQGHRIRPVPLSRRRYGRPHE